MTDSSQWKCIHPSIHFLYPLIQLSGRGGAGAYPSRHWARGRVHPGQVSSPSQGHTETNDHTHTHTHLEVQFRDTDQPNMHAFGQEEAGVPEDNPRIRRENMQTPHRNLCGEVENLEPSCCEATVITTTPPCSPESASIYVKRSVMEQQHLWNKQITTCRNAKWPQMWTLDYHDYPTLETSHGGDFGLIFTNQASSQCGRVGVCRANSKFFDSKMKDVVLDLKQFP